MRMCVCHEFQLTPTPVETIFQVMSGMFVHTATLSAAPDSDGVGSASKKASGDSYRVLQQLLDEIDPKRLFYGEDHLLCISI